MEVLIFLIVVGWVVKKVYQVFNPPPPPPAQESRAASLAKLGLQAWLKGRL